MKRLIVILLFFCSGVVMAEKKNLSGIISDEKTGETLIGATVCVFDNQTKGTVTNANGFFTLPDMEQDSICLKFSFIGYETLVRCYDLKNKRDHFLEVRLLPSKVELEQVTVVAPEVDRIGDRDVEISEHRLSPNEIKLIPSARKDVFRSMRFMPGIQPTEPLSPLVSVRGGDPGENLIMLDGVTMYNPYHFLSSSGIFNMQTVKNVDVLAGGFGAEFGGRNSSVINILTKDGSRDGLHGEITPTTSETSVFLEFPVGKKSTMMVAGRAHYDLMGNFILYSRNFFFDVNLSFTTRLNQTNWLTCKIFGSQDKTNLDFASVYKYIGNSVNMEEYFNDMSLRWIHHWKSNIATVIWKSALSSKLFLKAQTFVSMHDGSNYSEMSMRINNMVFNTSSNFISSVRDLSAIVNFEYKPFSWGELKAGMTHKIYFFLIIRS
ncbi:MAG TPA: carboxypeptidase-like regulatory domain-containing protein [Prolixibacteraceae bacterium]|nr:carboxypeptidase-like regulatory domain-containing protein [Prolixibacteraceae bacterium]